MRDLSRLGKKKRALSNIVAYVLLISISISLSTVVYGWLKFYVSEDNTEICPDGVSVIIYNYKCYLPDSATGKGGRLTVTLKNNGLFTADGYILRVHDRPNADFGFYVFDDTGVTLAPGTEYNKTYYFNNSIINGYELNTITFMEVQPFMQKSKKINCKSYSSQKVNCV